MTHATEPGVHWEEWSPEAFVRATRENKPVLLHIGAVWCHWCHVMDRTTYRDERVVRCVNEHFVPVRVDNDRRPDINRRYNMGGWPTTAFLTPSGQVLTGATYIPPEQMLAACRRVAEFWQEHGGEVGEATEKGDGAAGRDGTPGRRTRGRLSLAVGPEPKDESGQAASNPLDQALLERLADQVAQDFDAEYGGFGNHPKFPQVASLELALDRYLRTGDVLFRTILEKTLQHVAEGGMYDPVEGGFFRYSTTRDWSVPHFEKMLEDNARLLDLYLKAFQATGRPAYRDTAADVLRFFQAVLRNPGSPYLAGSQDADKQYYSLPLNERRQRTAPFVDRTVYTDWNALAAVALMRAGRVLGKPEHTVWGVDLVRALDRDLRGPAGGMAHFRVWSDGRFRGEPQLVGMLADQVEMMAALLAAYTETREPWTVERAQELAAYLDEHLAWGAERYFDTPFDPDAPGALKSGVRPMEENARAARVLLTLYQLTGREAYESQARQALAGQAADLAERYGSHGAVFGLALDSLLYPLHVVVVGPLEGGKAVVTGTSVDAARSLPLGALSVAVQDTAGANPHRPVVTYPAGDGPRAFVCSGATCFAPIESPHGLEDLIRRAARGEE
ncbi:MAG: thioredoxin domain-containing protein [Bacillota bacterium]